MDGRRGAGNVYLFEITCLKFGKVANNNVIYDLLSEMIKTHAKLFDIIFPLIKFLLFPTLFVKWQRMKGMF